MRPAALAVRIGQARDGAHYSQQKGHNTKVGLPRRNGRHCRHNTEHTLVAGPLPPSPLLLRRQAGSVKLGVGAAAQVPDQCAKDVQSRRGLQAGGHGGAGVNSQVQQPTMAPEAGARRQRHRLARPTSATTSAITQCTHTWKMGVKEPVRSSTKPHTGHNRWGRQGGACLAGAMRGGTSRQPQPPGGWRNTPKAANGFAA